MLETNILTDCRNTIIFSVMHWVYSASCVD